MENASKALLIAAAVLIVILLIAFGMRILSSTSGVGDSATNTGSKITEQANAANSAATNALDNLKGWTGTGKTTEAESTTK